MTTTEMSDLADDMERPLPSVAGSTVTLAIRSASLSIGGEAILDTVDLSFPSGEVVALIGHNGSGKSSLIKMMAKQLSPTNGSITLDGKDITHMTERAFARSVAYLPQELSTGYEMTVRELVSCGRYPWHGALGRFSAIDEEKVSRALDATQTADLADRFVGTLSGGERQRAWIAMLVAQDTRCLLLDEPTSALDTVHQIEILSLVRRLAHEHHMSVAIVLHDINMAVRFCDRIHALRRGRVVASGRPGEILVPQTLCDIYGIDLAVASVPGLLHPLVYAC